MTEEKSELLEIAALWSNTDKSNNIYYTGRLGNSKLLVLKNNFKEKDNQPDYKIYVTKAQKREDSNKSSSDKEDVKTYFDANEELPF